MEKNPPEKSNSFASRYDDDNNNNNNNNNPDPVIPSSCSPAPEFSIFVTKSEPHDTSTETTTITTDENNKETAEPETTTEKFSISDLDSTLPKISEDIDSFLFHLKSKQTPEEIPNCIDKFAKLVEVLIAKNYSDGNPNKWRQDSSEDSTLLKNVDRISKLTTAISQLPSDAKYSPSLDLIGSVLQRAMSYLEEEFRSILENGRTIESEPDSAKGRQQSFNSSVDCCILTEPDSAKAINFPGFSPDTVSNLNRIATAMIAAGYETECCQIYSNLRRNSFEDTLKTTGFEKISIDDVQKMQWEALEGEITNWIKVFKRCVTIYFAGERKLCDEVFQEKPSLCGLLFGNLTRGVVNQLFNFAEAVAMTKRSAEKLFKFLDMYEALRDMMPELDNLFSGGSSEDLKNEISSALGRLSEAAIAIFCDLENSIKSDYSKTPVPSGAVHPLTRYTMNYLKYACEYKDTLEQIFHEQKKVDQSDAAELDKESSTPTNQTAKPSPFAVQLTTVLDLLLSNLEAKSKLYKDLSLSYIFLMNNGRYIIQKTKGSKEIHELVGYSWCRKRSTDLRNYHKNYQRETWYKVLGCLKDEGLQVNGKVSKPALKERFKSFNSMFDEIRKTQSAWIVSDEQLQSELRVSISSVMIPAYRSFLGRFSQYLDSGRQTEKYIKYGPDDIESAIEELFEGNPNSMGRKKS
ncbi:hypothetical protein NE237_021249 [Protea cynaroides]|uniref:Exocyst subunit Exo70 family protein n=1 Tax=Protea cynaroides TaxID=273540 RepID=A0A9Q0K2F3_9MAGN|nr:hypothetical protein NE237_021249 [Protea cynaroides]